MNTDPNTTGSQNSSSNSSEAPAPQPSPPKSQAQIPINQTPPEDASEGTVWRFDGSEYDDKDNRAEFQGGDRPGN